ncbi:unnamed protein product [Allacma fusca]|uniref:Uncharacterized protein n=1 Tax=Allacma fusca TaxID=39272 RepID=A0A8J2NPW7_9HEXA|nr:unnamed protein product [Allacma fusca]
MVSKQDILANLFRQKAPREICNCKGQLEADNLSNMYAQSFCSDEATLRGENQHVISFSLYSNPESSSNATKSRYFDGVIENLWLMKEMYPDWIMRVYSNISFTPEVCEIVCLDKNIYFCNVHSLPVLGNIQNIHPMTWRFLAMGDPTVTKFVVRDLDSRLSQRDKDAVDQWEESGYPIHGMRDHPWHLAVIMGGMWGADNYKLCLDVAQDIQSNLLQPNWTIDMYNDQQILGNVVYAPHRNKILTHDSFACNIFQDSIPFPTKRSNDWDFVGRIHAEGNTPTAMEKCPPLCRPNYGRTWEYC